MELDLWTAIWAGLIAGMLMVAVRLSMRAAGINLRMNVALMWSTMFHVHGMPGLILGMAIHLMVSAVVGVIYAWGFAAIFNASDGLWLWGLLAAAIHWVIAGVFLAMAPAMNPEMPEVIPAPGMFAARLGSADVLGFLAGHLTYGVAFGIIYALLHPAGGAAAAF